MLGSSDQVSDGKQCVQLLLSGIRLSQGIVAATRAEA